MIDRRKGEVVDLELNCDIRQVESYAYLCSFFVIFTCEVRYFYVQIKKPTHCFLCSSTEW